MKKISTTLALAALALGFSFTASESRAQYALLSGSTVGWGSGTYEASMDSAFGTGNWQSYSFSSFDLSAYLSDSSNKFLFIDGSNENTIEFNSFLASNISALEAWVYSGGSLFLNVATNQGVNSDLGFNGTLATAGTFSATATVVSTGDTYSGNWFAHDAITGTGLTTLIDGSAGVVLAYENYGSGTVAFGGMTEPYYWSTSGNTTISPVTLLGNELSFVANATAQQSPSAVPEPSTYGLMGAGALAGLGLFRRLRRQQA